MELRHLVFLLAHVRLPRLVVEMATTGVGQHSRCYTCSPGVLPGIRQAADVGVQLALVSLPQGRCPVPRRALGQDPSQVVGGERWCTSLMEPLPQRGRRRRQVFRTERSVILLWST